MVRLSSTSFMPLSWTFIELLMILVTAIVSTYLKEVLYLLQVIDLLPLGSFKKKSLHSPNNDILTGFQLATFQSFALQ